MVRRGGDIDCKKKDRSFFPTVSEAAPPNTTDPTSLYYNELGRFVRGGRVLRWGRGPSSG